MRIIVLLSALLTAGACSNDGSVYPLCDLDPQSPDEEVASCGGDDAPDATCVVTGQIQCNTMACGRYQGSDEFCTSACSTDDDCESDDVCRPWGDLGRYCTPADL